MVFYLFICSFINFIVILKSRCFSLSLLNMTVSKQGMHLQRKLHLFNTKKCESSMFISQPSFSVKTAEELLTPLHVCVTTLRAWASHMAHLGGFKTTYNIKDA